MILIIHLRILFGIKALSFDEDDALIGVFDTVLNKITEDLLESCTVHVHL
jgi:hypothetical protein